jgi:predicted nucleic acid-binding Zn ribbon protein
MEKEKELKKCPVCGNMFERKQGKAYCSTECQIKRQNERQKEKVEKIKGTFKKIAWQKTYMGLYSKFYDLYGEDHNCDLCNISNEQSMVKFGIPLFGILDLGVRDFRVLDPKHWKYFCLDCRANVEAYKEE